MIILGALLVGMGPLEGPLGPQMADLGCQDTDQIGGNKKEVLDIILMQNGLTLATLSMDKGKCYLGGISGWSGALRGPLVPQMADLGCQDTDRVGGDDKEVLGAILLWDGLILAFWAAAPIGDEVL